MNILSKALGKGKKQVIAGVVLRQEDGVGMLIELDEEKQSAKIIDQAAFHYSNAWENLVYDIDDLLFRFEEDRGVKLEKAMFFVYAHLIDQKTGNLKTTYESKLTEVVEENRLESLGYLAYDEVLSKYLSQKNNKPFTGLLLEVDTPAVSAFSYRNGEKVFGYSVAKTEDITADVEEIVHNAPGAGKLPSQIVMYDSANLEAISHRIITHDWSDDIFEAKPEVDICTENDVLQSARFAVADQLFEQASVDVPVQAEPAAAAAAPEAVSGFVTGQDVREMTAESQEEPDVQPEPQPADSQPDFQPEQQQPPDYAYQQPAVARKKAFSMSALPKFLSSFSLPSMTAFTSLQQPSKRTKAALILALFLIIVVGGGIYAVLRFFHSAEITIVYNTETISEDLELSEAIAINTDKQTFTVESAVATTGTKSIGEKAKGEITIFNADEDERAFEKGTEFKTADGLVFLLDGDITVEAASTTITDDGDVLTETSKKNANVTAEEIGEKYNIDTDTKMTVEGFSDTTYFARTQEKFTGGTEEEIQTVSRDDLDRLEGDIEDKLQEQSETSISTGNEKRNVIEDLTEISIVEEDYSGEVAEEAQEVRAEVTADVIFYSYDESAIKDLIIEEISEDIPEGFTVKHEHVEFAIDDAEKDEDTGDITLSIEAEAHPVFDVDEETLKKSIAGTSAEELQSILEQEFKAGGYEMAVSTFVPFLQERVPFFTDNIRINVQSQ